MSSSTQEPGQEPVLPPKPKRSRTAVWIIVAVVAVAAIVAAVLLIPRLFASGGEEAEPGASAPAEPTKVKLGTTDASQGQWKVLQELAAAEGIDLELVSFSSYETPNPALASGEIDLNAFQHIDYLSNHNVATGDGLAVVGPTLLVPLPIYSTKYDDVADIPEGAQIAIPNDPSNQARALRVLEAAGLVVLDAGEDVPTPEHVVDGSKVVPVPVDPSLTAPALQDPQIAGAIINNNFALDAGIDPESALFFVDPSDAASWPYVNIIASRAGEEDDPVYQKIWELYHDPSVTEIVKAESGNSAIIVTETPQQVREWLAEIEAQKKAAS